LNFTIAVYVNNPDGLEVTTNCNHDIAGCEHAFKGRAVTFATTTILLLIHAYNCKNLKGSLLKMNVGGEGGRAGGREGA
jgi:hypothetical protein